MVVNKVIKAQGSINYPAADLVRKDPKIAAMISKTLRSNTAPTSRDEDGNRKTLLPHSYAFKSSLQKRAKRNSDAKTILRLLPDIELSIQILTSSILSPSDMMTVDLNFVGPKTIFSSDLTANLINRIKQHFEETYKIKPILSKILRDVLAEKGAYPVAVIPENSIDEFINSDRSVSMESMREYVDSEGKPRNIGILGNYIKQQVAPRKIGLSFEDNSAKHIDPNINNSVHYVEEGADNKLSYVKEDFLFVTDNPATLKIAKVNSKIRSKAIKNKFNAGNHSIAVESNDKTLSDVDVERMIYRTRQFKTEPVAVMKRQEELNRKSVGNPLILKLPSESVIPVHVPGNVEKHIGYFVILDEEGNPIEAPDDDHCYGTMGQGMSSAANNSLSSNIIRKVETNMGGGNFNPSSAMHLDFAAQVYSDMVERDLISRIKNGIHSNNVALAKNEEVYRIMLSRVLARKYTQILFLPIEYMTYFAFKYSDDGVGRSLLDDTAMINTLRTVMLFTDVISSIKNSIGRTAITMTLPENDPNPMKTIEQAQDEIVRSRQLGIPLGVTNPADITDFISRAGFEWKIEGHPGLPDLKFDVQATNTSYAKPDSELQDYLRKSAIMAMGLSPEMVDSGFNTEFATTVVANNMLLGKRVMQYQELFCPLLSDHLRKVAANSEELLEDLKNLIIQNKEGIKLELDEESSNINVNMSEETKLKLLVNKSLSDFLNMFDVQLPKPPSVTLSNQLDDLKTYMDGLDTAIDAYISDSFMTSSTSGDLSNEINTIKAMVKAYFTRKFLSDNGMMTELSDLTALRDDGSPQINLMKEITEHVEALVRSGVTTMVKLQPIVQAANNDLQNTELGGGGSSESESTTEGDGGSEDGGGSDMGDDFGGDLGMELDNGEEPADPDQTEQTTGQQTSEEPAQAEPEQSKTEEKTTEKNDDDEEPETKDKDDE